MIEASIFKILSTDADVSAAVANRIYPLVILENKGTYPCIVYEIESSEHERNFEGYSDYTSANIIISALADSYDASVLLSHKIAAAMRGIREQVEDHFIDYVVLTGSVNVYEYEIKKYRASVIFETNYR